MMEWICSGKKVRDCETKEIIAICKDVKTARKVSGIPEMIKIIKDCCKYAVSFDEIVKVLKKMGIKFVL